MTSRKPSVAAIGGELIEPVPIGARAVYLVETRSQDEAREVERLFDELESRARVCKLCEGKLLSYVVQTSRSDSALLDEIEDVLKATCGFVVTQGSFDEVIYRIVRELCEDTGSTLLPARECDVCGRPEPFPSTVATRNGKGLMASSRQCCGGCAAKAMERAELARRPLRNRQVRGKDARLATVR